MSTAGDNDRTEIKNHMQDELIDLRIALMLDAAGAQNEYKEIDCRKQDRRQRGIFSICIFSFVCIYVIAVLVIVILCGASVLILDTTVLVTILTTNTANVIGIFVIVAKYLFHTNDSGALPS